VRRGIRRGKGVARDLPTERIVDQIAEGVDLVHLGNRYIPRPVRVFKEFALQMTPTLFPRFRLS
jgi:hypothetical protein